MAKHLTMEQQWKRTKAAPFGRKADGTPRRKPGPPRGYKFKNRPKKTKKRGGR